MELELYNEILVAAIGQDCPALAAWVGQMVQDSVATGNADALAARRAAVHWQAASEDTRQSIGALLGLGGDPASTVERWPVPKAVKADYEVAAEVIRRLLD